MQLMFLRSGLEGSSGLGGEDGQGELEAPLPGAEIGESGSERGETRQNPSGQTGAG
jgi:hypothetical protein